MQENPYAPPQAEVADLSTSDSPYFFPVSVTKLMVLSVCTFGIYQLYWLYKNWKIIRDRTNEDISPFARTFFAIFYCYQLFDRIRKHQDEIPEANLAAGALTAAWIILSLMARLPDPYWLISLLSIPVLIPVQRAVNAINKVVAPQHDPNSSFTTWNWVVVVLGGIFLVLGIIGSFLPG